MSNLTGYSDQELVEELRKRKANELLERLYKKYPKDKQQILSHLEHIM